MHHKYFYLATSMSQWAKLFELVSSLCLLEVQNSLKLSVILYMESGNRLEAPRGLNKSL